MRGHRRRGRSRLPGDGHAGRGGHAGAGGAEKEADPPRAHPRARRRHRPLRPRRRRRAPLFRGVVGSHGVGPALALAIMAVLSPAALSTAVLEDDLETLCTVPGVGTKTAAPLLIELKSRLDLPDLSLDPRRAPSADGTTIGDGPARTSRAEARAALSELGYAADEIRGAVDGLRDDVGVEEMLRLALRELATGESEKTPRGPGRRRRPFRRQRGGLEGPRVVDPAASDLRRGARGGRAAAPERCAEFVGQSELVEHLRIVLQAARQRRQPVDHMLFAGPPGLGKTSLAGIVASEMGAGFAHHGRPRPHPGRGPRRATDRPPGRRRALHRRDPPPAPLGRGDALLGDGGRPARHPHRQGARRPARSVWTCPGSPWSAPRPGRASSRAPCVTASASSAGSTSTRPPTCGPSWSGRPASSRSDRRRGRHPDLGASRGTPRVANRLLRRVRDFAEVRGEGYIDGATASEGLELFGVDELGLDKVDRAILATLCTGSAASRWGLTTLAQCVGEEPDTIEDAYEPFLVQSGLIQRTARGRVATERAWAHSGHSARRRRRRNEYAAALLTTAGRRPHRCTRRVPCILCARRALDALPFVAPQDGKRGDPMAGNDDYVFYADRAPPWTCSPAFGGARREGPHGRARPLPYWPLTPAGQLPGG